MNFLVKPWFFSQTIRMVRSFSSPNNAASRSSFGSCAILPARQESDRAEPGLECLARLVEIHLGAMTELVAALVGLAFQPCQTTGESIGELIGRHLVQFMARRGDVLDAPGDDLRWWPAVGRMGLLVE